MTTPPGPGPKRRRQAPRRDPTRERTERADDDLRPSTHGAEVGSRYAPPSSPLARAPTVALGHVHPPDPDAALQPQPQPQPVWDAPPPSFTPRGSDFGPVRRFGEYTLVKKLATGGMAEIWLARQKGIAGFARFLVVKKILSHLAEQETFVRMFQDEARTSALLSHPNIVQIHDLGQAEGTYFIAMEYIAGENLAAIAWRGMKRERPFPVPYAARVIADACKALHYAHNLRGNDGLPLYIVHRDVSPQNILVTYEGEVKVVDFGIAKAATKTEHTKTGMLKGKFSYMSPEQCLGAPVDHRSDIFALGILLYELSTGKRLYKHESELMILDMITKRSVVPPSQVSSDIPSTLEDIILRALEKDPEARFSSAQDMQLALEDFLRALPSPVTNAEISAYMHLLFGDKIEEKRRLKERASRDDFEALFLEPEGPDGGGLARRRTVYGASPSQLHAYGPGGARSGAGASDPLVQGPAGHSRGVGGAFPGRVEAGAIPGGAGGPGFQLFATGSGAAFGTPSGFGAAHPYPTDGSAFVPGYGRADRGSQVVRIVTGLAVVVIVIASTVLYHHFTRSPAGTEIVSFVPGPTPAPEKPMLTGGLTVESSPSEADLYLDGAPMLLPDGSTAKTPSDLKGLQYGRTYTLTLKKESYRPQVLEVVMGEAVDGKTFHPALEPFPGTLVTEVRGPGARDARILLDGVEVGSGPRLAQEIGGNTTVLVEAEVPGKTCRATPARVRVPPNQTVTAVIECRDPPRRTASRIKGTQAARPSQNRAAAAGSGGCSTDPSLPPGYITIATEPYSTVFWGERKLGETPISSKRLPAGCVELKAVTADGKSRTVKLEVEPNVVRVYRFKI